MLCNDLCVRKMRYILSLTLISLFALSHWLSIPTFKGVRENESTSAWIWICYVATSTSMNMLPLLPFNDGRLKDDRVVISKWDETCSVGLGLGVGWLASRLTFWLGEELIRLIRYEFRMLTFEPPDDKVWRLSGGNLVTWNWKWSVCVKHRRRQQNSHLIVDNLDCSCVWIYADG